MPYQILVRHHGDGNLAALFSRGRCQDFPSLPFVAGEGQGLPPGAALSFWEEAGGMMVRNDGSVVARLEESSLGPGATGRISLGGVVVLGDREVRLYRLHGRPGASRMANAMGFLAVLGVALSLLLEAGVCLGLGRLLMGAPSVRKQVESQALTSRVDQLRKRLKSREIRLAVEDAPLAAAYLEALQEEMDRRVAYLRRPGEALSPGERKAQMENLDRLELFLDRLEERPSLGPAPAPLEIEGPVRGLIQNP